MSAPKPPRTPAGDLGTADRIEADAGHYWVRLWSRQAIWREGAAMFNCLRKGDYDSFAGGDDPRANGLWSLRDETGLSIALAEVALSGFQHRVRMFLGVSNSPASKLAYRQLRHLGAMFEGHGSKLHYDGVRDEPVVVGPDGMTYRWDHAPEGLRLSDHEARMEWRRAAGERRRREQAAHEETFDDLEIPAGPAPVDPDSEPAGDPIEIGNGVTVMPRADGFFRIVRRSANSLHVIEKAYLSPIASEAIPDDRLDVHHDDARGHIGPALTSWPGP